MLSFLIELSFQMYELILSVQTTFFIRYKKGGPEGPPNLTKQLT